MGRIDGSFTRNWNVTLARFTRADQWECRLLLGVVPNAGLEHVDSTRGELFLLLSSQNPIVNDHFNEYNEYNFLKLQVLYDLNKLSSKK